MPANQSVRKARSAVVILLPARHTLKSLYLKLSASDNVSKAYFQMIIFNGVNYPPVRLQTVLECFIIKHIRWKLDQKFGLETQISLATTRWFWIHQGTQTISVVASEIDASKCNDAAFHWENAYLLTSSNSCTAQMQMQTLLPFVNLSFRLAPYIWFSRSLPQLLIKMFYQNTSLRSPLVTWCRIFLSELAFLTLSCGWSLAIIKKFLASTDAFLGQSLSQS